MKNYAVILNFELGKIHRIEIPSYVKLENSEDYLAENYEFSLSNCEYMFINEYPIIEEYETEI